VRHRLATRPEGAPLRVILQGFKMRRLEGRPAFCRT
jgi:hypothetical protein